MENRQHNYMDRNLIFFLLKRPSSWFACASTVAAKLKKQSHVVTKRHGISIRTRIGNGEGLFCAVAGLDYENEMRWLMSRLKPGMTFLDVGANVGIYSLHASRRIGETGRVYAFEPTPETFDILNNNILLNKIKNVDLYQVALSNLCGTLNLIEGGRPASNGTAIDGTGKSIPALTLDQFRKENPGIRIDSIKVDIEGGERAFFEGARETLLSDQPVILFESMHTGPEHPERHFLWDLGYRLYFLENKRLLEIDRKSLRGGNVIAIR